MNEEQKNMAPDRLTVGGSCGTFAMCPPSTGNHRASPVGKNKNPPTIRTQSAPNPSTNIHISLKLRNLRLPSLLRGRKRAQIRTGMRIDALMGRNMSKLRTQRRNVRGRPPLTR